MMIEKEDLAALFPDNLNNLEQLSEEASEVIQAKSKVVRFGLKDTFNDTLNPDQTNQEKLEAEIGQFLAVVDVLVATGILRQDRLDAAKPSKWSKMKIWGEYKGTREREEDLFNASISIQNKEELLPCEACGNVNILVQGLGDSCYETTGATKQWKCVCSECNHQSLPMVHKEATVRYWNDRP